jgi:hypothetical protein
VHRYGVGADARNDGAAAAAHRAARGWRAVAVLRRAIARRASYFGPLQKLPTDFIDINFAFSRARRDEAVRAGPHRARGADVARLINDANCHVYICGLKGMEQGVDEAFRDVCRAHGIEWDTLLPELARRAAITSRPTDYQCRPVHAFPRRHNSMLRQAIAVHQ